MTRLLRLFALTAPLLLAAGCKQGVGERCQVDSDCDDGLRCQLPVGATPQSGGVCMAPGGAVNDLAVIEDLTPLPPDLVIPTTD
jgi:hypothetical protein